MYIRIIIVLLMALSFSACSSESLCDNRMESHLLLSDLDATYTLRLVPTCDAIFTLAGDVTAAQTAPAPIDISVTVKGSDCTIVRANGTGADKVAVKREAGEYCSVQVPFTWTSGVSKSFEEVSLRAQLVAVRSPDDARCKYVGPTPGTNVGQPFSKNELCQLPFS